MVLAAGAGERLGTGTPKAFQPIAGTTMLGLAVSAAAACPAIRSVVAVVPTGWERRAESLLPAPVPLVVVTGGATRQESVRLALDAVPGKAGAIACHDAARPFASTDLFESVIGALAGADGAVPLVPVPDTVKRVRGGVVLDTLPREDLGLAQTPQGFRAQALREAHAGASAEGVEATDDAALLERMGFRVVAVPGDPANFKVTTREDLARAEALLAGREAGGRNGPVEAARG